MAEHIPFVTGEYACDLVKEFYSDSECLRVPLDHAARFCPLLPSGPRIWIDPAVDGLDDLGTRSHRLASKNPPKRARTNPWYDFITGFPHAPMIADPAFHRRPDRKVVGEFVKAILAKCAAVRPAWISVPQLPAREGRVRNKINRALAAATGSWKATSGYSGRLILPIVFTNQKQLNGKTARNLKVQLAERCYQEAQADGVWVVDKSLTDDNGSRTLRDPRFPGIISLHEELNEKISPTIKVAGPYWGLNIVLWARGLVDYPAIGIGNAYQYYLAGTLAKRASAKLALHPLRRRSGVGQLSKWLKQVVSKLGPSHPACAEFGGMLRQFPLLRPQEPARRQVAEFHKKWFDNIAANPPSGRSMALFQDLSSSYALGKSLPNIPGEKTARRPESVAEPLMLSCL